MSDLKYESVTDGIINAFYHIYNKLGYGFLEKVYENSLAYELTHRGFIVDVQKPITVWYDGVAVGEYYADLIVNQCIIVELKCGTAINSAHEAQLVNYLKATGMEIGLLLNFGPKPEFKRKIFSRRNPKPISFSDPH